MNLSKSNINQLFSNIAAIQAEVVARETIDGWVKFTVNIMAVYKRGGDSVRRGEQVLWVEMRDLMCKCPKVRFSGASWNLNVRPHRF